jgi:hypothetical protein
MGMEGYKVSSGTKYVPSRPFIKFAAHLDSVHIFKFRMVNGACLTMAINGWLFLTQIYYIPTFYQLVYGYSAIRAGALLLPLTLIQSKFLHFYCSNITSKSGL